MTELSEADFVELLRRTSTRGANHAIVRNYVTRFSGPQSWAQRCDAGVMSVEAQIQGRSVNYRPNEFELLECSDCQRWRRVDLDTARLFSNWHWLQHEYDARRAALMVCCPNLLDELRRAFYFAAPANGTDGRRTNLTLESVDVFWEKMTWKQRI